jgi:hypothetical protein
MRVTSIRSRTWTYLWAAVALSLLGILLVKQSWVGGASLNDPRATPRAVSPRGEFLPDEKSTIALFRQASPAVVNITAIGVNQALFS